MSDSYLSLASADRDKLLTFLGYGRLDAPFWFLGMEEGSGGKDEQLELNISARLKFPSTIMDLRVAHNAEHLNWIYWDTNAQIRFPSVWVYMARLVRALSDPNSDDWWDTNNAKTYIRERLGRSNEGGETLLTEILPLPKRRAVDWPAPYKNAFGFQEREDYDSAIICDRKNRLKALIAEYKPKYLFCYGETHYSHYRELIDVKQDQWQLLPDSKIEVATVGLSKFVLSPFWGNGRIGYTQIKLLVDRLHGAEN